MIYNEFMVEGKTETAVNQPNKSEIALDRKRQRWEKELHNLNLYHGTSVENAKKIMVDGLKPTEKPYTSEDQLFLEETADAKGVEPGIYAKGKDNSFFVTSSEIAACGYAVDGPEMVRIYLLPLSDELMKRTQGSEDYERIKNIHEKLIDTMVNHRPALLKIKKDSTFFRDLVKTRLSESYVKALDDFESFACIVDEVKTKYEISDEVATEFVLDEVRRGLLNVATDMEIKPENLKLISGDEFDNLNVLNRKIAEVRDFCLRDEKRQPSELIRFLYRAVCYDSGNLNEMMAICSYFGIDKQGADAIYQKAMELQKLENNIGV